MSEFTEKRDDLMTREKSIMHHLFLAAISDELTGDGKIAELMKEVDWDNAEDIPCHLVVGSRKFPLKKICERWEEQMDAWVAKKAQELLETKLRSISDIAYNIEKKLAKDAKDLLGLEPDEYGW